MLFYFIFSTHRLLNVLIQIANKKGLVKICAPGLLLRHVYSVVTNFDRSTGQVLLWSLSEVAPWFIHHRPSAAGQVWPASLSHFHCHDLKLQASM
jgi:hypothetical protein